MGRKSPIQLHGFSPGTCTAPAKLSTPMLSTGTITTGMAVGGKKLSFMNCMLEPSPRPGLFWPCASGSTISRIWESLPLELMPVADFPGQRNWGYDGVFPFAPDSTYGRPEDLKELVQSAHEPRNHGFAGCRLQPLWPGRKLSQVLRSTILYRSAPYSLGRRHQLRWLSKAGPSVTSSSTMHSIG